MHLSVQLTSSQAEPRPQPLQPGLRVTPSFLPHAPQRPPLAPRAGQGPGSHRKWLAPTRPRIHLLPPRTCQNPDSPRHFRATSEAEPAQSPPRFVGRRGESQRGREPGFAHSCLARVEECEAQGTGGGGKGYRVSAGCHGDSQWRKGRAVLGVRALLVAMLWGAAAGPWCPSRNTLTYLLPTCPPPVSYQTLRMPHVRPPNQPEVNTSPLRGGAQAEAVVSAKWHV